MVQFFASLQADADPCIRCRWAKPTQVGVAPDEGALGGGMELPARVFTRHLGTEPVQRLDAKQVDAELEFRRVDGH